MPAPFGVYVHVPFCERKCLYCDFNSGVHRAGTRVRYVDALVREIGRYPLIGRAVCSVFFGGGTPSVLSALDIGRLLSAVGARFPLLPRAEITVECNPGTVASERLSGETSETFLSGLHDAGVNRLSFGVQSFDAGLLRRLGRIHDPDQAVCSVGAARAAGINEINLDLMFALPGQTLTQWRDTLSRAIDLGVPHISAYSLIVEPGTPFARLDAEGKLDRPSEEAEAAMYELAMTALEAAGYEHYEVSAFAKPGHRCLHNMIYWRNEEYIGFGTGAASYMAGERFVREEGLERYLAMAETDRDTVSSRERLDHRGTMGETMMMQLRLRDGVNRERFALRFGIDPVDAFPNEIARHTRNGLLEVTAHAVRLTHRGLLLANEVWEAFV